MCLGDLAVLGAQCQRSETVAFPLVAAARWYATSGEQLLLEVWPGPERFCLIAGLSCSKGLQSVGTSVGTRKRLGHARKVRMNEQTSEDDTPTEADTVQRCGVYGCMDRTWQIAILVAAETTCLRSHLWLSIYRLDGKAKPRIRTLCIDFPKVTIPGTSGQCPATLSTQRRRQRHNRFTHTV